MRRMHYEDFPGCCLTHRTTHRHMAVLNKCHQVNTPKLFYTTLISPAVPLKKKGFNKCLGKSQF